jgi:hypothetical protein
MRYAILKSLTLHVVPGLFLSCAGFAQTPRVLCFISSNSWLDVAFDAKLLAFLLRNIVAKAIYGNPPFMLL